jgi:hypothetical protein
MFLPLLEQRGHPLGKRNSLLFVLLSQDIVSGGDVVCNEWAFGSTRFLAIHFGKNYCAIASEFRNFLTFLPATGQNPGRPSPAVIIKPSPMNKTGFALLFIWTFVFYSCFIEDKCFGSSCTDQINFKIIDKTTGQDLVFGSSPIYKIDSMQLNSAPDFSLGINGSYVSRISGDYHGLSTTPGNGSIDTFYLRLTHNDIDTLAINFTLTTDECCTSSGGYGTIVSINYNGKVPQKSGDNYLFEK